MGLDLMHYNTALTCMLWFSGKSLELQRWAGACEEPYAQQKNQRLMHHPQSPATILALLVLHWLIPSLSSIQISFHLNITPIWKMHINMTIPTSPSFPSHHTNQGLIPDSNHNNNNLPRSLAPFLFVELSWNNFRRRRARVCSRRTA